MNDDDGDYGPDPLGVAILAAVIIVLVYVALYLVLTEVLT